MDVAMHFGSGGPFPFKSAVGKWIELWRHTVFSQFQVEITIYTTQ